MLAIWATIVNHQISMQMRVDVNEAKPLLHILNCTETTFIMEANTMNPDQTAPSTAPEGAV